MFHSLKTQQLLIITLVCMLISACSKDKANGDVTENEIYQVPVETVKLAFADMTNTYRTTAILEAQAESRVTNKVTGMIEKIHVEEGMFVEKGQLLAEIDSESYQLEYERASIDLASAVAEYNRSKPVNGKELISLKELDRLKFSVQTRTNQQKIAAIKVRDSKVRAPIAGVIAERKVKEGNNTPASDSEMFYIVALDTLQGVVYLPESELNNIQLGQPAQLVFPANDTKPVAAKVALISPIVDTKTGTFKVTLAVENDDARLKPGMFAKVAIVLDVHENVQVVPQSALSVTDTETSLFIVQDNKAKRLVVETDYEQNGLVEITTQLASDAQIVVVGQQALKPDAEVVIVNQAQEAEDTNVADAEATVAQQSDDNSTE